MLSKSLYNEAWERVCREQVDLVPTAFCKYKVSIDDAMTIAKATTHADGKQFIGRRLAGEWEEGRYILFQGKYGTIVVCWKTTDESGVWLVKSPEYEFDGFADYNQHVRELEAMIVEAVAFGFKLEGVTFWYDSTYRKITKRETPGNFDSLRVMQRLMATIKPGLTVLKRLHTPFAESVGEAA